MARPSARSAGHRRRVRLPRPSSLAGQTLLVLLVGLTLSHLLSLGLYSLDRLRLLEVLGGRAVVARVVEATRLIEASGTPREERRLLRILGGGGVRVTVRPAPLVKDLDDPTAEHRGWESLRLRVLRRALVRAFAEDGEPRSVRVGIPSADTLAALDRRPDHPPERPPERFPGTPMSPPMDAPTATGDGSPDHGSFRERRPGFDPPWMHRDDEPFRHGLHRWVVGDPDEDALAVSVGLTDGRWLTVVTRVPRPQGFWTPGALASLGLMAVVILALSVWAVRRMTRPLRAVAEAARRLGVDPRRDPLPETGSREVREVAHAFNEMRTRLARLVDNRTRLLAAISHDLRTPITTLRLRAEFVDDAEERARMLATLDDMEAMVRATLDFARDDVAAEPARAVDLTALVAAVCDDLAETGQPVTRDEDSMIPVVIHGRPTALRRAVTNLVVNACRHGDGATVSVEPGDPSGGDPSGGDPAVAVVVRDDGPGIPKEHIARVTDPFYRVEGSRSRETAGIGLGLSIVQAVADAHGGRLVLRNRAEGGLEARLELPPRTDAAGETGG